MSERFLFPKLSSLHHLDLRFLSSLRSLRSLCISLHIFSDLAKLSRSNPQPLKHSNAWALQAFCS